VKKKRKKGREEPPSRFGMERRGGVEEGKKKGYIYIFMNMGTALGGGALPPRRFLF
jgi:hypothetical protein